MLEAISVGVVARVVVDVAVEAAVEGGEVEPPVGDGELVDDGTAVADASPSWSDVDELQAARNTANTISVDRQRFRPDP